MRERQGVLITGVFGSGKTSVAVEMADILEKRGVPYGVLDLDWLAWGWPGSAEADAEHQMMLRNLAPVVRNYLDAGVRFFIFARNIRHASELDSLRATVQMPLRVIRLVVSWPEIERRLQSDIATGRQDDLREATAEVAGSQDPILEDLSIASDGPLRGVATRTLNLLGWI
jgi:hypothetical protein